MNIILLVQLDLILSNSFAKTIEENVEDEECYKMAIYAIQQARMFANQGATLDELRKKQEEIS